MYLPHKAYELPPGTDVLERRRVEAASAHGRLERDPFHSWQTTRAIADRVLSLGSRLAETDGRAGDALDQLREVADVMAAGLIDHARASFNLGSELPWRWLEAAARAVLDVEHRLSALDRKPAPGDDDLLARILAPTAIGDAIHRHEDRFHAAVEQLVGRVPADEFRLAAIEARTPARAS